MNKPEPYPYQLEGIQTIERFNGRALLADDMGLGKSLQALWWLARHRTAIPAVVVCPASVKWHWQREAMAGMGVRALVLEGRRGGGASSFDVVIVNYDILSYRLDQLRQIKPRTVVIDECQFISNRKTRRSKAVRALCKGVPHVLALSGTPLQNRPIELWPALNILRPNIWKSWWLYAQEFCAPWLSPWGWQFRGASNVAKLHKRLTTHVMIRRRKVDVLEDLPPKVRQTVPLPLTRPEEYRRADDDFLAWLRQKSPEKVQRARRAEALVKMEHLKQLAARLKLRYVVEWTNRFMDQTTDEKLILYTVHRKMAEALRRRCRAGSLIIDGSVVGRKREEAVDRFRRDNKVRLLIGNIKAVGVGTDGLQDVASAAAFTELPWTPGAVVQAEDRIWRIGTERTVWIYYLVAHGTVEEMLCELIQKKQETLTAVLDGRSVGDGLSLFDQLLNSLRRTDYVAGNA